MRAEPALTKEDGMRSSTEMLMVGGAFALAAVGANAVSSFLGTAPTDWTTAVAYGLGLGVVVFLVRFVDGETAAQGSVEHRIAKLEKAVALLTSEGGAAATSQDATRK